MSKKIKSLRELLKEFSELIADEAERNSKFAEELKTLLNLTPEISTAKETGKKRATKTEDALPDLYLLFYQEGKNKLASFLDKFNIKKLKWIIKEYKLDLTGESHKSKKKEELISLICKEIELRENRGSVFRQYEAP